MKTQDLDTEDLELVSEARHMIESAKIDLTEIDITIDEDTKKLSILDAHLFEVREEEKRIHIDKLKESAIYMLTASMIYTSIFYGFYMAMQYTQNSISIIMTGALIILGIMYTLFMLLGSMLCFSAIKSIYKLVRLNGNELKKYIHDEIISSLEFWKDERNSLLSLIDEKENEIIEIENKYQ